MPPFLLQAAGMAPDDCALSGLCALLRPEPAVPPGVMFTAMGLVALGTFLWWRERRTANGEPGSRPTHQP